MKVMIYFIALISILLGSFAQFLLKTGMSLMNVQQPLPSLFKAVITNIPLISGILCYVTSLFFWVVCSLQARLKQGISNGWFRVYFYIYFRILLFE